MRGWRCRASPVVETIVGVGRVFLPLWSPQAAGAVEEVQQKVPMVLQRSVPTEIVSRENIEKDRIALRHVVLRFPLRHLDRGGTLETIEGVIILAAIEWGFLKQRPQHFAEGFVKQGSRVLFIENTGVRSPRMSDLPRIWARVLGFITRRRATNEEDNACGVEVFSPLALPFPYNPYAIAYNTHYLRKRIQEFLSRNRLDVEQVVLFTYLTTPLALAIADSFAWGGIIYDVVSDPKKVEPKLAPYEGRFLRKADLTLFASATLRATYGEQPQKAVLFRDGYSLSLLDQQDHVFEEVDKLPRPRFLYLGGINRKVCPDFVVALADAFPEGSVVLVGPIARTEIVLPVRPNVFLFPPRERYEELSGFLRAADAALIPYRPDDYAGAMHPAKINEYLVYGLPIIGARTPELQCLEEEFGEGIFYLAHSPEEFAAAARRAVAEDSPGRRRDRLGIASQNNWDSRVRKLMELILSVA